MRKMTSRKYLESTLLSVLLVSFLFIMYASVYMTKNIFAAAMASIVEEGFMSKSQTGMINALFWLVYAPFQVLGGFAADKYSPYKLVLLGVFGAFISNLILFFNQSYTVMLIIWPANAVLQFGLWPGIFKIVSTQIAPKLRDAAVFWMMFSTSVGIGLSMLVASFVSKWQYNFIVSAAIMIFFFFAFIVFYNLMSKKMVEAEVKTASLNEKQKTEKAPMGPLLVASGLVVLLVVALLKTSVDNGIKMLAPVLFMESYDNIPAAIATRMSTILIVFNVMGTLLAGVIKNRITRNEITAQLIMLGASLLPVSVCLFVGKIHYVWVLCALSVGVSLINGSTIFGQSYVAVRFGKYGRIGTVSGILNATASVGNIMASYVFARMSELMPWNMVILCWIILIVACFVLCAAVYKKWTYFIKKGVIRNK